MILQYENAGLALESAVSDQLVYLEPKPQALKKIEGSILLLANQKISQTQEKILNSASMIVTNPGEYESQGVFVYALEAKQSIAYLLHVDHMMVGTLWVQSDSDISSELMKEFSNIDILVLDFKNEEMLEKFGGKPSSDSLLKVINNIEPRILIIAGKENATATQILKLLGNKFTEDTKVKLMKKDLPSEDMLVYVI